jgi:hypothetical protein
MLRIFLRTLGKKVALHLCFRIVFLFALIQGRNRKCQVAAKAAQSCRQHLPFLRMIASAAVVRARILIFLLLVKHLVAGISPFIKSMMII